MSIRKAIKGSLISLAILGMISGSINSNIANAKHRHAHYSRRIHHIRSSHKRGKLYRHRVWLYGRGKITPHYKWVYSRSRKGYSHHARHIRRSYKRHAREHYARSRAGFHFNPRLDKESKSDRAYDEYAYHKNYLPLAKHIDQMYGGYLRIGSKKYDHYFNLIEKPEMDAYNKKQEVDEKRENQEIPKEEVHLINQDRAENDQPPLQESQILDQIAQMRAKQDYYNNSGDPHTDPNTGEAYYLEDAQKLGYDDLSNAVSGENLGEGCSSAKEFNDQLYTEEKPYDGGHYQNIVGQGNVPSQYNKVGVGCYNGHLAEEFMGPVDD